jgi:hypothetical protein
MVYWADIHGCPAVLGTYDVEPADNWFADRQAYSELLDVLVPKGITTDEAADFCEGTTSVQGMELELLDVEGLTALLKSGLSQNRTRLTAYLSAVATTVTVDSTSGFPTSGVIHIGQEAIRYTGKSATQFTGCTRGYYNTEAVAHVVDYDAVPPRVPVVRDGFWPLTGRRVNLYVGELDETGQLVELESGDETECIFRGLIGGEGEVGEAAVTLPLEHLFAKWDESIGDRLFSGPVQRGYYYKGLLPGVTADDDWSLSVIRVTVDDAGTRTVYDCDLDEGFYDTPHDLAVYMMFGFHSNLAPADLDGRLYEDEGKWHIEWQYLLGSGGVSVTWRVQRGDPLFALGFKEGIYSGEVTSSTRLEFTAEEDPKAFVMELTWPAGDATRPYCKVPDEAQYTAGTWAVFGGEGNQTLKIASVSTTGQVAFTADPRVGDPVNYDWKSSIIIEDEADLVLSQVFASYGDTLRESMQRFLGLLTGQPEPARWCIRGIEADDVDWDELDDALVGAPSPLRRVYLAVTKPAKFQELFCDRLGVLGIAPRVTDEGRIGFVRITDPVELNAHEIELDEDVAEYLGAAHIRAQLGGDQYLTRIELNHSLNWVEGAKDPRPCSVDYDNGTNVLGKPYTLSYRLRGVHVGTTWGLTCFPSTTELVTSLASALMATHFTYFAGESPVIPFPVTHRAKGWKVGDILRVTHDCAPDPAEGVRGMVGRLGLIVRRQHQWTDQAPDVVYLMMPAAVFARPIAPCSLATSWVAGTKTLTFAATNLYCQSGETDLDEFSAGDKVLLTEYDDTTPTQFSATIVSVDPVAKTVVLDDDPFGGSPMAASGCWMHWPSWDSCSEDQQRWLFIADTSYGLGATPDDGHQWGV